MRNQKRNSPSAKESSLPLDLVTSNRTTRKKGKEREERKTKAAQVRKADRLRRCESFTRIAELICH